MEPVVLRHLLVGEVCPRHMSHRLPVALGEAIRGLTASGSGNDIRLGRGEVGFHGFAKEFLVAVRPKAFRKAASLGTEKG